MKIKTLDKKAMLANINGLSKGDKAYCGPYGTIRCYASAKDDPSGVRRFAVSGSSKLVNGGNWNMRQLRKAIGA